MTTNKFFRLLLCFFLFFIVQNGRVQAQTDINSAYSLFIYNFAKYSQWPDGNSGSFKISVLGKSTVYNELKKISASKKINGRAIEVVNIKSVSEIGQPDLLFVPTAESGELANIINNTGGKPIMVISEKKGSFESGACISFYVGDDSKLKFQINDKELTSRNLKMAQSLKNMAFKG